jgi:hypothetical protein
MTHLEDYLNYYKDLNAPGYAVLVTGSWGVGKTHQVRRCLPEDDCYYVSLFGLRTPEEAHAAVYAAYAPNLDKLGQGLGTIQNAANNAGGLITLAGTATGWLNAALRRQIKPDRLLIFDDLERCGMSLEEMMGVFSTYSEHLGFQMVLIADEEKLLQRHVGYATAKEKVIGHTSKVGPMTSDAFDAFVIAVDDVSRDYIQSQKQLILDVFKCSDCKSLRILRHVVFDLARLHQSLEPKHIKNQTAMTEIIGLFVACGIEVRLGRLSPSDLNNRAGKRMGVELRRHSAKNNDIEKSLFVEADDRYSTIDMENQILNDQILKDIFEHGVFEAGPIKDSVDASNHFLDLKDIPAWNLIASFDELPDGVLQEALEKMNAQFDHREVTSSGEILHIFALRLMMADEGISGGDVKTVCAECCQYIEDLLGEGRLPARELHWRWWDKFDQAYGGYGYWIRPSYQEQFKEIWHKLIAAREEALAETYSSIMTEIMKSLEVDGRDFYRQLCHTAGHDSPYALLPVLPAMKPSDFVDAWLNSPRPAWRWVSRTLEDRLEPHRLKHELSSEKEWALDVLKELEGRRDGSSGFDRLRIDRIIPKKLRQLSIADDEQSSTPPIDATGPGK